MLLLPLLAAWTDVGETKAQAEQAAKEMHARLDANGDGFVTYEEMRRGTLARIGRFVPPDRLKNVPDLPAMRAEFDDADLDHDGRLSLAEELAAVDRTFDREDTDHDGRVTMAERMAFIQLYLAKIRSEMAALPKPACVPGAACHTVRR
jgi:Ca2+-binding EF-hand superfamily protein